MISDRTPDSAKLGPVLATVLVAGNMIGSGIYLLPATLATVGGVSIFGWLVAALGAMLIAGVFSALAVLRPDVDGMADYARIGLGRYVGFQTGVAYWVSNWTGVIAISLAVTGYLTVFLPVLHNPLAAAACTTGVVWLLTFANIIGARFVGKFGGATLAAGLLPVAAVGLFGWLWFDPKLFMTAWNVADRPPLAAVQTSLVLIFWAFTGMETAIVAASLVRRPERNVPIATIGGVAIAAVVYMLASTAIDGILPASELARSSAPFAAAVTRMLGPAAASLVALCAMLKAAGTACGITLLTAETTRASAATGYFPRFLAAVRPNGMPAVALLCLAALETVTILLTISPTIGRQFEVLIDISTVLTLVMYAWCALSLLRLSGGIASPAWRLVVRTCAVLGFAFCLWAIVSSELRLLLISLGFIAVTVPAWLAVKWAGRAQRAATAAAETAI